MNKKLSILILTIPSRIDKLNLLLSILKPQKLDAVEILICSDNLETNISVKRNYILEKSVGEYICYVDDDDLVSTNYIKNILKAIENKPDCCGIKGICNNQYIFINSINHQKYLSTKISENGFNYFYLRNPNHFCPIKREIALKNKFPLNKYSCEDMVYTKNIRKYIYTETFIDEIIYFYSSDLNISEMVGDKIENKKKTQIFTTDKLQLIYV